MSREEKQIEDWIVKGDRSLPLLVWGPLQSGKKTIIRNLLKKYGYYIIEPIYPTVLIKKVEGKKEKKKEKQEAKIKKAYQAYLEAFQDMGPMGKNAYLVRLDDIGNKRLPNVKKSPVIYVCDNPYHYMTKAELQAKYHVINLKTGRDFSVTKDPKLRDFEPNFWQAMGIVRAREPINKKLEACHSAGDYMREVAHMSYLNKDKADPARMVRAADSYSLADTLGYKIPTDMIDMYKIIIPSNYMLLSPQELKFQQPKIAAKEGLETDPESCYGEPGFRIPAESIYMCDIITRKQCTKRKAPAKKRAPKKKKS